MILLILKETNKKIKPVSFHVQSLRLSVNQNRATGLSSYDFSALYAALPSGLIGEELLGLVGWTFRGHWGL